MKTHQANKEKILPAKTWFLLLTLFWMCCGCRKFVAVPAPTTQIVTANIFNNNASANAAQLNIYNQMANTYTESYNMALFTGLLSDELTVNSSLTYLTDFYTNAMNVTDLTAPRGPWSNGYNYIYQANAVIEGLQNTVGVTNLVKQQLTGEAMFTRAFWHFYLSNCYGDIPLVLTTNYVVNAKLSETPRIQVLQQVVSDLKQAYVLLSPKYVDASDTTLTTERVRPNRYAAAALLARVYLYLGDYGKDATAFPKAEQMADSVINNSQYSLAPLSGVFLKNSSETIWQLQVNNTTFCASDATGFILTGAPSTTNTFQCSTVSTQLLNTFEFGDQRRANWIGSYSSGGSTWYFPFKYKYNQVNAAGTVHEYYMVLRLAEIYLIRAEARAAQGAIAQAVTDINIVRNRAGLANYSGATDQPSVLAAILHERQVELFTEWGARWFDLNRMINTTSLVNVNTVMSVVTPSSKNGIWRADGQQTVYPIPQTEINNDPNLRQNPGY